MTLIALAFLVPAAAFAAVVPTPPVVPAPAEEMSRQQGLAGPGEGESIAAWAERWIEGPVSLLATSEEIEIYEGLGSTQERLQFIRLFWHRRNPAARGEGNEFLEEFRSRLAYVEEEFSSGRTPGWKTVFGEVALVYGPPNRTRRDMSSFPQGFSDRPAILWTYDARLPGLPPNEDLLFVFRQGRWRLLPPSPIGDNGVAEQMREAERNSSIVVMPTEYRRSMSEVIEDALVNVVNYSEAIDAVQTRVTLPEAQIPFSWSTSYEPVGGATRIDVLLSWRMDSLIFHLVDGSFATDMVLDVQLIDGDEPVATETARVLIEVPESQMDSRREEIVQRTVTLEAAPGTYRLELVLLDQLLGYRTVYTDDIEVPGQ